MASITIPIFRTDTEAQERTNLPKTAQYGGWKW